MKYKIDWVEEKTTSTGKVKLDATITDNANVTTNGVTLWAESWPNYRELVAGTEIEGDLVEKQNGQYLNKTLYPIKEVKNFASALSEKFGGKGVKAAQERKEVMIKEAQERKNESIAFFNANNSAINLVSKYDLTAFDGEEIKAMIIKWRDWFLEEWQKYEVAPAQDKHIPF